jgi:Tfp pilus assembly protein PilX
MVRFFSIQDIKKQGGVVLVVGLIMLLLTTLLGVAAMQTTTLEEKMALNHQERQKALLSSEAAARHAWNSLKAMKRMDFVNFINNNGQPGFYDLRPADFVPGNKLMADWTGNAMSLATWPWGEGNFRASMPTKVGGGDPMNLAIRPQYVIGMHQEVLRKGGGNQYCIPFTIVAAGQGSLATSQTQVKLEAIPLNFCGPGSIK